MSVRQKLKTLLCDFHFLSSKNLTTNEAETLSSDKLYYTFIYSVHIMTNNLISKKYQTLKLIDNAFKHLLVQFVHFVCVAERLSISKEINPSTCRFPKTSF